MGEIIGFAAGTGTAQGYLAAKKAGKGPGIVVIQEWWGLVPHIQDVCERLATEGFIALAPDLYHGEKGKSPDEAGRLMMALDIGRAAADLGGAVKHLLSHPQVSGKKVGVAGFCMGGQLALFAASKNPEIGACADFYGIHPKVSVDYAAIRCPVLGLFGGKDEFVSPEAARKLESSLKSAGVQTDFTVFPQAGHAFFNDSRPEAYNKLAASRAWEKLLGAFRKSLLSPA
ncbi:MAG: dienelactone hydrolase family protein [Elusimicrobia bacterium]|nr:dienelactone hydrolase family protein [Elusimicrobiota bacterium]